MMIHDITSQAGANRKRKRVGRGESSGMGRTSGRGNKGMGSRAGHGPHVLHEGGQFPINRRVAKRGFSNFNFEIEYTPVNLDTLEKWYKPGETVDPATLRQRHLVSGADTLVKLLARGALTKKLSIRVHAASDQAKAALEKSGSTLELIPARDSAALAKAKRRTVMNRPKKAAPDPTRLEKKNSRRSRS